MSINKPSCGDPLQVGTAGFRKMAAGGSSCTRHREPAVRSSPAYPSTMIHVIPSHASLMQGAVLVTLTPGQHQHEGQGNRVPPSVTQGKNQTNQKDNRNQTQPEKSRYMSCLIGLEENLYMSSVLPHTKPNSITTVNEHAAYIQVTQLNNKYCYYVGCTTTRVRTST